MHGRRVPRTQEGAFGTPSRHVVVTGGFPFGPGATFVYGPPRIREHYSKRLHGTHMAGTLLCCYAPQRAQAVDSEGCNGWIGCGSSGGSFASLVS